LSYASASEGAACRF